MDSPAAARASICGARWRAAFAPAARSSTLPRRRRRIRPRPIVLLCDVSGSMERYTRTLLLFAHTLAREHTRCRGVPVRDAADAHHHGAARAASRCGHGRRVARGPGLVRRHAHRRRAAHLSSTLAAAARCTAAPVVILISDGWDRGDPRVLRDEIARLQRSCHRLVWLNPLIGTLDYAPLTRGLQAALPFVDDFLPVRTLRDVRDLALHLGALETRSTWTSPAPTRSPRRRDRSGTLMMDPAAIASCIPGLRAARARRRRSLSREDHHRHGRDHRHLRRHGGDLGQGRDRSPTD